MSSKGKFMSKPNIKIGDIVTCKNAVFAYGYQRHEFKPGTRGVIAAIMPKVCKIKVPDAANDLRDDFLVVDYDDDGIQRRTGIDYINVVKLNS